MDIGEIVELVVAAEPVVQAAVMDILRAFKGDDDDARRKAIEAALRLAFEARQDLRPPVKAVTRK